MLLVVCDVIQTHLLYIIIVASATIVLQYAILNIVGTTIVCYTEHNT